MEDYITTTQTAVRLRLSRPRAAAVGGRGENARHKVWPRQYGQGKRPSFSEESPGSRQAAKRIASESSAESQPKEKQQEVIGIPAGIPVRVTTGVPTGVTTPVIAQERQ